MLGFSERGLIHLIAAGAKERRQMETQRQIYEKLREMEAEEKARRALRQHVHREEKRHRVLLLQHRSQARRGSGPPQAARALTAALDIEAS